MIQTAAIRTNKLLLNVIQNLPSPAERVVRGSTENASASWTVPGSPTPTYTASIGSSRTSVLGGKDALAKDDTTDNAVEPISQIPMLPNLSRPRMNLPSETTRATAPSEAPPQPPPPPLPLSGSSRPHSPQLQSGVNSATVAQTVPPVPEEGDPFDYQATVNELTVQFLSEYEETRVAALKWLIMLHQKAPKKVLEREMYHICS